MQYRKFTVSDLPTLKRFVLDLYRDDPGTMHPQHIHRTVKQLTTHPDQGTILMFETKGEVIGYAILINFWSNEYSGNILMIDELYVAAAYRSQGVASNFIQYLITKRFQRSVGLQLEVTHKNVRARKLYDRLGFKLHKNNVMFLPLSTK